MIVNIERASLRCLQLAGLISFIFLVSFWETWYGLFGLVLWWPLMHAFAFTYSIVATALGAVFVENDEEEEELLARLDELDLGEVFDDGLDQYEWEFQDYDGSEVLGPVIGRFKDSPIYEFIEITDENENGEMLTCKLFYDRTVEEDFDPSYIDTEYFIVMKPGVLYTTRISG